MLASILQNGIGVTSTATSASVSVPVTAITAGSLIVVFCGIDNLSTQTISNVTDDTPGGSNTYTHMTSARATNTTNPQSLDVFFCSNAKAGATSVSFMKSASDANGKDIWVYEIANADTSATPNDGAAVVKNTTAATTSPTSGAITVNFAGDIIITGIMTAGNISAAGTNYTLAANNLNGNDVESRVNPPTGSNTPGWTQTSGAYCTVTTAWKSARVPATILKQAVNRASTY